MALIRIPRKLRPPATKSGRLTPSQMKRKRVYTNADVERCELEYIDVLCTKQSYYAYMKDGARKRLTRCTKIAGLLLSDRIVDWAARMAAEYVLANWDPKKRYTQERINAICWQAEKAHELFKDFTADLGKEAHALIEKFLHTGIWPAEFAYYLGTGEWPEWAEMDPRVGNSLMLFHNEWAQRGLQMVQAEFRVYDMSMMIGGTVDCVAYDPFTGEYLLIDYKTGNGIWDSHLAQFAFYEKALERMGARGYKISRVIVFRIGREDAVTQVYEIPRDILDIAFRCFELLAELRPGWVKMDGVLAKERTAWRAANNLAAEKEDAPEALEEADEAA